MHHSTIFVILFALAFARAKPKTSLQWAICDPSPQDTLVKLGLDAVLLLYKESLIIYYDKRPPIYLRIFKYCILNKNKSKPAIIYY